MPAGIAVLLYLTRRLGPVAYGEYATVMAVIVWIEFAITSLLSRATIKLVAEASGPLEEAAAMVRLAAALVLSAPCSCGCSLDRRPACWETPRYSPFFNWRRSTSPCSSQVHAYVAAITGLGRFGRRA